MLQGTWTVTDNNGDITFLWDSAGEDDDADGVLVSIPFTVSGTMTSGTTAVTISDLDICNYDLETVNFETTDGSVTVQSDTPATVTHTVTFKVVNGSWDDDSSADKSVTLSGPEGSDLKLAADQIPAVGTKPDTNYKAGGWDTTPSTETSITADMTYTYT